MSITAIAIDVSEGCREAGQKTLQEPCLDIEIALIIRPKRRVIPRRQIGSNRAAAGAGIYNCRIFNALPAQW
jgi:hypothetical protein